MDLRQITALLFLVISGAGALLLQPASGLAAMDAQGAATQGQATAAPTGRLLTDCSAARSRTDTENASLPNSARELLTLLVMCRDTARMLISEGQFGLVFLPAMEGKDIALALEGHVDGLATAEKERAISAIRRLVIAAWQVDADGDLGNKEKLSESYGLFAAAIADVTSAYSAQ